MFPIFERWIIGHRKLCLPRSLLPVQLTLSSGEGFLVTELKKEPTVSLIVKTYFQVFSASYILGYGVLKIFKGFIFHPDIRLMRANRKDANCLYVCSK